MVFGQQLTATELTFAIIIRFEIPINIACFLAEVSFRPKIMDYLYSVHLFCSSSLKVDTRVIVKCCVSLQPSTGTSDDEQLEQTATVEECDPLPPSVPPREEPVGESPEAAPPLGNEEEEGKVPPAESQIASLTEEFCSLDETMKEIAASIQDISEEGGGEPVATVTTRMERLQSEDLSDDDTDSDDDGTGRIDARALYDYTARSDKELSFKRGDTLQVVEKTPDHNWWDGFLHGKRGFLPVSYIEVMELEPPSSPLSPPSSSSPSSAPQPGPAPPQVPMRKDSIPILDDEPTIRVVPPPTIAEEAEPHSEGEESDHRLQATPELNIEEVADPKPDQLQPGVETEEEPKASEEKLSVEDKPGKLSRGSVRTLTAQFQEPPAVGRVLVEPVLTHRRQHSDHRQTKASTPDPDDNIPRSQSSGSKVGVLSSAFERPPQPSQPPPPPVKPKPLPHLSHPLPSISSLPPDLSLSQSSGGFQIQAHSSQPSTGVSPLQRASLAGHLSSTTGATPPKRPAPPPSNTSKTKTSFKVKRDKSFKKDRPGEERPAKPPPPAKPASFIAPGVGRGNPMHAQQMRELQAAVKDRKVEK